MFANAGLCERTPTEDAIYYETEYVRKAGEDEERSRVAEGRREMCRKRQNEKESVFDALPF